MNISEISIEALRTDLCKQFRITKLEDTLHLNTGTLFHTGECVEILIEPDEKGFLVSDYSSAVMYLESHGFSIGHKLKKHFSEYAEKHGCKFEHSRVQKRCTTDQIPVAVAFVSSASKTIGDYIIDIRKRESIYFKRQVLSKLEEAIGSKRIKQKEAIRGHSSYEWHIDTVVLDKEFRNPIAFIETVYSRSTVPRRVATFFDLHMEYPKSNSFAVVPDENDLRPADLGLLKPVCKIYKLNESNKISSVIDKKAA